MTATQKIIRYIAIGFAALLAVSIIGGFVSAIGAFGGIFFGDAATGEMKTYAVTGEINDLEIDISAADITLAAGDAFSVESNLKSLTVTDENGMLSVKETKKLFQNYNGATLVITVPAGTVFDGVRLTTGAGKLTVDSLSARVLDCTFGAGDVKIDELSAGKRADIDGGAGKITVSGGSIADLDFDMGVGQLNFTSRLTGECELDLGVGESNITLLGEKADYALNIEKGLGSISVDGKTVTDFGSSGSGQNKIKINGGIGAINITFDNANEE